MRPIYFTSFILFFITSLCAHTRLHGQGGKVFSTKKIATPAQDKAEILFIEAEKYYILGNYEKALFYFKKASKLNPSNGDIYYKIAETLTHGDEENQRRAVGSIEKALTWDKKNKYFYLLASDIYANSSNFSKAAQVLSTMIKEVENTNTYLYSLGKMYRYAGKSTKALKVYDRAESIFGPSKESLLPKYEIYVDLGKNDDAMKVLTMLVSTFPDEESYSLKLAESFSKKQEWKSAIDVLSRYVEKHPKSQNSRLFLAELYHESDQKDKARLFLQQLFTDPSVDVDHKIGLMNTYVKALTNKELQSDTSLNVFTLELFRSLQKSYPDDPNVNVIGGYLYLALDSVKSAVAEYRKAFQKGSTQFNGWQNILSLEMKLNQPDSLLIHSQEAIDLFPDQAIFYYFNGFAYLQQNDYKQAFSMLEEAKKRVGKNFELTKNINEVLGYVYYELKEYKKSDQIYEETLRLYPNDEVVLNNYSYSLAERGNSLEKAERMASKVAKNNPANNVYLGTYAWVLFMRGEYKKAKKIMENILKTNPSDPVFFDHYGDILFKSGNIEKAIDQWRKAKSKGLNTERLNEKIMNKKLS